MPYTRHKGVFLLFKLYIMQFTTRVLTKPSYLFIRKLLVFFIFIFVGSNVFAQPTNNLVGDVVMPSPTAASLGKYTDIPVSHFTGVPGISVPIYTVQEGVLSIPISVSYHASGIKVGEPASRVGTGWSLNAGGVISRTVLGLADEEGNGYLTLGASIENNSLEEHHQVAQGNLDSQPDIFSYNFAGYTGKFFFDKNGQFHHVQKSDIQVTDLIIVSGEIRGMKLITPDGSKYYFGRYQNRSAIERTQINAVFGPHSTAWYLLRVENHNGGQYIDLEYETESYEYEYLASCEYSTVDNIGGLCGSSGNSVSCSGFGLSGSKSINIITSYKLSSIKSSTTEVSFYNNTYRQDLNPYSGDNGRQLDEIKIRVGDNGVVCESYLFDYSYFIDPDASLSSAKRLKLDQITRKSCSGETFPPYVFHYNGGNFLPHRLSKSIDHWGFYNGVDNEEIDVICPPSRVFIPELGQKTEYGEAGRNSDENSMLFGMLEKIDYPTGGSASFEYEANRVFIDLEEAAANPDASANAVNQLFDFEVIIPTLNTCSAIYNDPVVCCGSHEQSYLHTFTASEIAFGEIEMELKKAIIPINENPPGDCVSHPGTYTLTVTRTDIPNASPDIDYNFTVGFDQEDPENRSLLIRGFENIVPDVEYEIKVITQHGRGILNIYAPQQPTYGPEEEPGIIIGGLRVKKTTLHDGSTSNDIVKNYTYRGRDDKSSGVLYSFPQYAGILVMDEQSVYYTIHKFFRSSSITPLGNFEGFHIGYKRVVESIAGNGATEYNYFIESRPLHSVIPVAPEPPTYKNGKVEKISYSKEGGEEIKSIENTPIKDPVYFTAPGVAYTLYKWGFTCIDNGTVTVYKTTEYPLKTAYYRLESTETIQDGVTSLSSYEYDNLLHTNLTASEIINSDGEVHRMEYSYAHEEGNNYMQIHNMVGIPITEKKIVGGVVGGTKTTFTSGFPTAQSTFLGDGSLLPRSTISGYTAEGYPEDYTYMGYPTEDYTWNSNTLTSRTFEGWNWGYTYFPGSKILNGITDIDGQTTDYKYDEFGRLEEITERGGAVTTSFTYNIGSGSNSITRLITYNDPSGGPETPDQTFIDYFDGLGRLVKQEHNGIIKQDIAYDEAGRLAMETYLPGSFTRYEYEPSPLNRVYRTIFPDGNDIVTQYGNSGNYYRVGTTNERGITSFSETDILGRAHKTIDGNGAETKYEYDERSNLIEVIPPVPPIYEYDYDIRNRMTTKKIPGSEMQHFFYDDAKDLLEYSIDGNGNRLDYIYDNYGRELKVHHNEISNWNPNNPINYGSIGDLIIENTYGEGTGLINTGKMISTEAKMLGSQSLGNVVTNYTYDSYGRISTLNESNPFGSEQYDYSYNLADWMLEEDRTHVKTGSQSLNLLTKRSYDGFGRELFYNTRVVGSPALLSVGRSYNEKDQLVGKYYAGLDPYSALDYAKYRYNIRGWLTHLNDVFYDLQEPNECGDLIDTGDDFIQVEQTVNTDGFLDLLCQNGPGVTIDGVDPCTEGDCYDFYYDYNVFYVSDACHSGGSYFPCTKLDGIIISDLNNNISYTIPLSYPYYYNQPSSMDALEVHLAHWMNSNGIVYDDVEVNVVAYDLDGSIDDDGNRVDYYEVYIKITGIKDFDYSRVNDSGYHHPFTKTFNRSMPCQEIGNPNDGKPQGESLADILSLISTYTPGNISYPVVAYKTHLENGNTHWIPKEALPLLTGSYRRTERIHIGSNQTSLKATYFDGSHSNLTIADFIQELINGLGSNITSMDTESEEDECQTPEVPCTPNEQAAQDESLAAIQNDICNANADDFEYPLTVYLVQLCNGTTVYIPGDEFMEQLEGPYIILDDFIIEEPEDRITNILVTIPRPLFSMHFSKHQENGNIEEMRWKVTRNSVKAYHLGYEKADRLAFANYGYYEVFPGPGNNPNIPSFVASEEYSVPTISYDDVGNILDLERNGMVPGVECLEPNQIDRLDYAYNAMGQLEGVDDYAPLGPRSYGFKPASSAAIHYEYDNNGNMVSDAHKGLNITYNYLNLPEDFGDMEVTYDATGRKWEKEGENGVITQYYNGIEYKGNDIEAIYTPDGRLVFDGYIGVRPQYRAEYFHQDHLGNNRIAFCDFNLNGKVEIEDDPGTQANELEITQETHYYPFGMEQNGNWYATVAPDNAKLYNGKEFNRDEDINLYDYGARWYDPAIARWGQIDPLAENYYPLSPYNYVANNPLIYTDPDGREIYSIPLNIASTVVNDQGVVIDHKYDGDPNIYLNSRQGIVIGKEKPATKYYVGQKLFEIDNIVDTYLELIVFLEEFNVLLNERESLRGTIAPNLLRLEEKVELGIKLTAEEYKELEFYARVIREEQRFMKDYENVISLLKEILEKDRENSLTNAAIRVAINTLVGEVPVLSTVEDPSTGETVSDVLKKKHTETPKPFIDGNKKLPVSFEKPFYLRKY